MATKTFDSKCYDLAEYFYPDATVDQLNELASDIQQLVEDRIDSMDRDTTPYCLHCGPERNCDCGLIAANN